MFGDSIHHKTNRKDKIKNFFTINNEGKRRFGSFIADFRKYGIYPLGKVINGLDKEKLRMNPHHLTVLNEINEYITGFIREKKLRNCC